MVRAKECSPIQAKVIATCCSLIGFVAALAVGWSVGNAADTVLLRAVVVMFGCYAAGWVVGLIAQHVVQQHVDQYKQAHPILDLEPEDGGSAGQADGSDTNPQDTRATQS